MTVAELRAAVAQIGFTGTFRETTVVVHEEHLGALVTMKAIVPDVATGHPVPLYVSEPVRGVELAGWDPAWAVKLVHEMLRRLARHEADEAIVVGGVRPFDPHRPERDVREAQLKRDELLAVKMQAEQAELDRHIRNFRARLAEAVKELEKP